jgi:hypothetical protein
LEKKYAEQYLEMRKNEKKESTEAKLKWTCEKFVELFNYFKYARNIFKL